MPKTQLLYYISPQPVDLMIPRTPKSEDRIQTIPRICFNTSIQGCLTSINETYDIQGGLFKVYVIETDEYYKPTLSEVPNRDLTGEVWIQYAVEPEYLYDIEVTGKAGEHLEESGDQLVYIPQWKYTIKTPLTEDTRNLLVSKSRSTGPYKNQMRGKNRFERKKHSQIAKTVKQYNKIDMNKLFKEDILEVAIPVTGETDSYTVNVRMEGVVKEIARNIKSNQNKLEYRTVVQSLTKIFNTANIFVKCSCPDYKYRFAHWNIVKNVSVDDTSKDPGPGKGIRNPNDDKGRGCKHVLLVLANGDWVMKVASVINNYIHYAEKHLQKAFIKLIFPKLYGIPFDEAIDQKLLPEDFELETTPDIIDVINDYGRNRGKYRPGTNKNPVTGTGGKQAATQQAKKETEPEAKKTAPEQSKTKEPKPEMPEVEIVDPETTTNQKPEQKQEPKKDVKDEEEKKS